MKSSSPKLRNMIASLNDIIEQTYYFEQKVFEWGNKVKANKEAICKAMGKKEKIDVVVDENTEFRATKSVQTDIEFFPDKLKESLPKEKYNKVIDKSITISDLDSLILMLKEYGVPAKKFKEYINVDSKVNVGKVDNLIEMGEIEIDEIQGCYKVEFSEQIKVSKTK
jgi:hypothetical protein